MNGSSLASTCFAKFHHLGARIGEARGVEYTDTPSAMRPGRAVGPVLNGVRG